MKAARRSGRPRVWTAERVVGAYLRWHDRYGAEPQSTDWHLAKVRHDKERADRLIAEPIPSLDTVSRLFGGWRGLRDAAQRAGGLGSEQPAPSARALRRARPSRAGLPDLCAPPPRARGQGAAEGERRAAPAAPGEAVLTGAFLLLRYERPPWGVVVWLALDGRSGRVWLRRSKTSRPRARDLLALVDEVRHDLQADGAMLKALIASGAPHFRSAHLARSLEARGVDLVRCPAASRPLAPLQRLRQDLCQFVYEHPLGPDRLTDSDLRAGLTRLYAGSSASQ